MQRSPWPGSCSHSLDIELVQGATELCDAFAGRACTVLDVEHAELVAIERDRFAVRCQMLAQRLEIAERRLGRREMQRHQPASRIVNEHQQRAGRRTFLEPAVIAAVNLDQFTQTRTTVSGLVNLGWTIPARNPQTCGHHQRTHRLHRQTDAVTFPKLLARQGRPEIRVALTNDRQRASRTSIGN